MAFIKEIPFFSVEEINEIKDYNRFYYTKAYLKQKSGDLTFFKNQTGDIKKLAIKSGYKNFNKFIQHRKEWHILERKIPLAYLKAIGVDLDVLEFTTELDKEAYEKVLSIPLYPKYFMLKITPLAVSKPFPPGLSENEAIEYLKDFAYGKKLCLIHYPSIKTIGVRPDRSTFTSYYEPGIKITREYAIPTYSGPDIGKVFFL